MTVTTHCIVTVEYTDGRVRLRSWSGQCSARKLLKSIDEKYEKDATIRSWTPGRTWSTNSYGAH